MEWRIEDIFLDLSFSFKKCSMNNKNPETDIEVQPEDQKSKVASPWLLHEHQTKMMILSPQILRMRLI